MQSLKWRKCDGYKQIENSRIIRLDRPLSEGIVLQVKCFDDPIRASYIGSLPTMELGTRGTEFGSLRGVLLRERRVEIPSEANMIIGRGSDGDNRHRAFVPRIIQNKKNIMRFIRKQIALYESEIERHIGRDREYQKETAALRRNALGMAEGPEGLLVPDVLVILPGRFDAISRLALTIVGGNDRRGAFFKVARLGSDDCWVVDGTDGPFISLDESGFIKVSTTGV